MNNYKDILLFKAVAILLVVITTVSCSEQKNTVAVVDYGTKLQHVYSNATSEPDITKEINSILDEIQDNLFYGKFNAIRDKILEIDSAKLDIEKTIDERDMLIAKKYAAQTAYDGLSNGSVIQENFLYKGQLEDGTHIGIAEGFGGNVVFTEIAVERIKGDLDLDLSRDLPSGIYHGFLQKLSVPVTMIVNGYQKVEQVHVIKVFKSQNEADGYLEKHLKDLSIELESKETILTNANNTLTREIENLKRLIFNEELLAENIVTITPQSPQTELNSINKISTNDQSNIETFLSDEYYNRIYEIAKDLIYTFNSSWIDYVNKNDQTILNYVKMDSPACKDILKFNAAGKKQKFKSIEIKSAVKNGNDLFIKVKEEIEIDNQGQISIKNYNWVYKAVLEDGEFKIYEYVTDKNPSDKVSLSEDFIQKQFLFYNGGSFEGGIVSDGISISDLKVANLPESTTITLHCSKFDEPNNVSVIYGPDYYINYLREESKIKLILNGVRSFETSLELFKQSNYINNAYFASEEEGDDSSISFTLEVNGELSIRAYELTNPGRLILELRK